VDWSKRISQRRVLVRGLHRMEFLRPLHQPPQLDYLVISERYHASCIHGVWHTSPQGSLEDNFCVTSLTTISRSMSSSATCLALKRRILYTSQLLWLLRVSLSKRPEVSETMLRASPPWHKPLNVPSADNEIAVFTHVINSGHQNQSAILKTIEDTATSLAKTGANAAAQAVGAAGVLPPPQPLGRLSDLQSRSSERL
jgi:hypothetical protein